MRAIAQTLSGLYIRLILLRHLARRANWHRSQQPPDLLQRLRALGVQRGLISAVLLQLVEVFLEQQPGGLLRIVQFGRAARLFPEDAVDVLKGLFEHRCLLL